MPLLALVYAGRGNGLSAPMIDQTSFSVMHSSLPSGVERVRCSVCGPDGSKKSIDPKTTEKTSSKTTEQCMHRQAECEASPVSCLSSRLASTHLIPLPSRFAPGALHDRVVADGDAARTCPQPMTAQVPVDVMMHSDKDVQVERKDGLGVSNSSHVRPSCPPSQTMIGGELWWRTTTTLRRQSKSEDAPATGYATGFFLSHVLVRGRFAEWTGTSQSPSRKRRRMQPRHCIFRWADKGE